MQETSYRRAIAALRREDALDSCWFRSAVADEACSFCLPSARSTRHSVEKRPFFSALQSFRYNSHRFKAKLLMETPLLDPVLPVEGRHVLHLFFRVDYGSWDLLETTQRIAAKTALASLVQEIRATPGTQLLTFSIVSPKSDLGFMLLTADLHTADAYSKQLGLALGPGILTPEFSWLSMTERSEYTTSENEYAQALEKEEKLPPGSPEFEEKLAGFQARMEKYLNDRLKPNLPDWPVICFYPMSKRRGAPGQNWYALDFPSRKKLMGGHARVGRTYAGRVLQLITGSTGLDDMEWGVTLFAKTTSDIKAIVYEMRFDQVSAQFAEFGEFFIGLQMPLDSLFARLNL